MGAIAERETVYCKTFESLFKGILRPNVLKYHCLYFLTGPVVYQVMSVCEQSDNNLGQIISKTAYRGSTVDERCFFDGKFTFSNYTEEIKPNLKMSELHLEKLYYPICIKTLKNYLQKRETQVNRKGIKQSAVNSNTF